MKDTAPYTGDIMLGDISGLEKIYIVRGYNPLMACVPLSKTSLRWIRHPVQSSFSAKEDGTGSKHCSVNLMVSC